VCPNRCDGGACVGYLVSVLAASPGGRVKSAFSGLRCVVRFCVGPVIVYSQPDSTHMACRYETIDPCAPCIYFSSVTSETARKKPHLSFRAS
jgi:hypothetical protein